ncbi:MAG: SMC-Scp complex subunit ScpB [Clostridiales bacterium]|nr:SMC-Scp complex subunit ScpB [Clostridiales bacterium]
MEIKQYQAAIEAVLFAAGEPVAAARLAEALELDEETVTRLAEDLKQEINTRGGGLLMVRLEDRYQLCTRQDYAGYVRRALEIRRNTPLSQAAMEVLAIIAYNQPVTRAFIEQVRGVDCGAVVQGLTAKNLVEEKGRLELPGRPLLYGTTSHFLRCFGISALQELPPLPQQTDEETGMTETTLDEVIEKNVQTAAE